MMMLSRPDPYPKRSFEDEDALTTPIPINQQASKETAQLSLDGNWNTYLDTKVGTKSVYFLLIRLCRYFPK